jgi:hypothetical protein
LTTAVNVDFGDASAEERGASRTAHEDTA